MLCSEGDPTAARVAQRGGLSSAWAWSELELRGGGAGGGGGAARERSQPARRASF